MMKAYEYLADAMLKDQIKADVALRTIREQLHKRCKDKQAFDLAYDNIMRKALALNAKRHPEAMVIKQESKDKTAEDTEEQNSASTMLWGAAGIAVFAIGIMVTVFTVNKETSIDDTKRVNQALNCYENKLECPRMFTDGYEASIDMDKEEMLRLVKMHRRDKDTQKEVEAYREKRAEIKERQDAINAYRETMRQIRSGEFKVEPIDSAMDLIRKSVDAKFEKH